MSPPESGRALVCPTPPPQQHPPPRPFSPRGLCSPCLPSLSTVGPSPHATPGSGREEKTQPRNPLPLLPPPHPHMCEKTETQGTGNPSASKGFSYFIQTSVRGDGKNVGGRAGGRKAAKQVSEHSKIVITFMRRYIYI